MTQINHVVFSYKMLVSCDMVLKNIQKNLGASEIIINVLSFYELFERP